MDYKKIYNRIQQYQDYPPYAIPFAHPKLNTVLNGIERSKYTVVAGRSNSAKTSFVDFYYVISLFDTYLQTEPSKRKPLHILYFEMKDQEEKKLMKWFASYMFLKHKRLIDINTLRNTTGKSFELTPDIEDLLHQDQDFFRELNDHITMEIRPMTSTDIYLKIKRYMESIGSYQDGIYQYDKEHEEQITLVVVNNTARIKPEMDGYSNPLNNDASIEKLNDYMRELIATYKISPTIVHSIKDIRVTNKGEPSLQDLGIFGSYVDQGIIMYNPYNYNNMNYMGYDVNNFIINRKNRLSTLAILRNNSGIDNAYLPLIFLGEASYFRDCPQYTQGVELGNLLSTLQSIR